MLVGVVTDEVAWGLVVLQERLEPQEEPLEVMVQSVAVMTPVMTGLFSEQEALEPPFKPLQAQVQVVEPFTLLALEPELQE